MADQKRTPNMKKINNWLSNINTQMNRLYGNTYYTDKDNLRDMDTIADDIEDDITNIINRNKDSDISGVSKIYSRMKLKDAAQDGKVNDAVRDLFEDNPLTNEVLVNYIGNKWIRDLDNEIDTVLKYCTKMQEALDLMQDAVLSSDSFSKDFLNTRPTVSKSKEELAIFSKRSENIIKKYDIQENLKKWYKEASTHGEQFIYIVPYDRAMAKVLNTKTNTTSDILNINVHEATNLINKNIKNDSTSTIVENCVVKNIPYGQNTDGFLTVEFDLSRTLKSCIENAIKTHEIVNEGTYSLYESKVQETGKGKVTKKTKLDDTVPNELELPKDFDDYSPNEGIFNINKNTISPDELKVKGCIIKTLKRECVIPLYVDDDVCLGYYYVEFNKDLGFDFYSSMTDRYGDGHVTQGIEPLSKVTNDAMNDQKVDELIRSIANKISKNIDKNFINANQDLTKEIYAILKYNDVFNSKTAINHMKISFLPEEDVHRLVFNIDSDTHRGISDCAKGLIPAKLFSCLYITNSTGILTRGQDKRVYYVKQTVETNISQMLLNVINQIKKSNFGIRQIENMNNILNITGRFNDFVIPVSQTGDSPVQFEIMPGQQFDINTDLYNMLEEMAVNSTGVPIELVQSRNQPDFATQFTSSSIKILRTVYTRQAVVEEFISPILSKIYNCEYAEQEDIDVELPPPLILNVSNNSQIVQSNREYVNSIAEFEYEGEDGENVEKEKAVFIRKMMRHMLSSYIKFNIIDTYKEEAKMEVTTQQQDTNNTNG